MIPSDIQFDKNEYIISTTDILRLSQLSSEYKWHEKYELLYRESIMKRFEHGKIRLLNFILFLDNNTSVESINNHLKLLMEYEYYDVYVWDQWLNSYKLPDLINIGQLDKEQFNHNLIKNKLMAYEWLDIWAHYLHNLRQTRSQLSKSKIENNFSDQYYTRQYKPVLRLFYTNFFKWMSDSVFSGYLKSHPDSLPKLVAILTNDHYDVIQEQDDDPEENDTQPIIITKERKPIYEIECKSFNK